MTMNDINKMVAEMNSMVLTRNIAKTGLYAAKKRRIKSDLLEVGILAHWNKDKKEYEAKRISGYYIDADMSEDHGKEVYCSLDEAMEIAKNYIVYGNKGVRIFDKNGYVATAIEYKELEVDE